MVTLRRDVAALNSNGIFANAGFDSNDNLTDYDIFMQQKRSFENSACTTSQSSAENHNLRSDRVETSQDIHEFDNYESYMRAQLNRSTPGTLLSEDQFYSIRQKTRKEDLLRKNIVNTKVNASKKLTKQGKIFVAIYLLLVAVVACIIISVNTSRKTVLAKAGNPSETVAPLAQEDTDNQNKDNSFDKVLDKLTNK